VRAHLNDSDEPNLSESDKPEKPYDAKQALHTLKSCYKEAEQNPSKVALRILWRGTSNCWPRR